MDETGQIIASEGRASLASGVLALIAGFAARDISPIPKGGIKEVTENEQKE